MRNIFILILELLCLASIGIVIATTVIYALLDPGIQAISKLLNIYNIQYQIKLRNLKVSWSTNVNRFNNQRTILSCIKTGKPKLWIHYNYRDPSHVCHVWFDSSRFWRRLLRS